ncbi:hypothetical protein [Brevundimonas nasdae]|uniref:hypothetical protein n=1 Tax=Brevundimonas nasdae TaxID=172043 RepID=UPI003F692697
MLAKFDLPSLRFSMLTLGVAASAAACGLIGSSILQAPEPQVAACMSASGLKAFAYSLCYGGAGLLALWALAETRGYTWEWHGWREAGRPLLSLRFFRDVLSVAVVVAIIASFVHFGDAVMGSGNAAQRISEGACPSQAVSADKS